MVRTDKDAVGCGLDEAAARKLPLDSLPRMICAGTNLCSEENSGRAEASDVILTLDMPENADTGQGSSSITRDS